MFRPVQSFDELVDNLRIPFPAYVESGNDPAPDTNSEPVIEDSLTTGKEERDKKDFLEWVMTGKFDERERWRRRGGTPKRSPAKYVRDLRKRYGADNEDRMSFPAFYESSLEKSDTTGPISPVIEREEESVETYVSGPDKQRKRFPNRSRFQPGHPYHEPDFDPAPTPEPISTIGMSEAEILVEWNISQDDNKVEKFASPERLPGHLNPKLKSFSPAANGIGSKNPTKVNGKGVLTGPGAFGVDSISPVKNQIGVLARYKAAELAMVEERRSSVAVPIPLERRLKDQYERSKSLESGSENSADQDDEAEKDESVFGDGISTERTNEAGQETTKSQETTSNVEVGRKGWLKKGG